MSSSDDRQYRQGPYNKHIMIMTNVMMVTSVLMMDMDNETPRCIYNLARLTHGYSKDQLSVI